MNGTFQTRDDILEDNLPCIDIEHTELYFEALRKAESIHKLLGLNDYSRCDFRLKNSELFCMEVSTHPFLPNSPSSSFIMAARQELLNYGNIIDKIISSACERYNFQN